MENRDRDKINQDESSSTGNKTDSESNFGKNIDQSESWDIEPKSDDDESSGSSGWQGDSGRSSGGSRSDLGEQSDVRRSSTRSSSDIEH